MIAEMGEVPSPSHFLSRAKSLELWLINDLVRGLDAVAGDSGADRTEVHDVDRALEGDLFLALNARPVLSAGVWYGMLVGGSHDRTDDISAALFEIESQSKIPSATGKSFPLICFQTGPRRLDAVQLGSAEPRTEYFIEEAARHGIRVEQELVMTKMPWRRGPFSRVLEPAKNPLRLRALGLRTNGDLAREAYHIVRWAVDSGYKTARIRYPDWPSELA